MKTLPVQGFGTRKISTPPTAATQKETSFALSARRGFQRIKVLAHARDHDVRDAITGNWGERGERNWVRRLA